MSAFQISDAVQYIAVDIRGALANPVQVADAGQYACALVSWSLASKLLVPCAAFKACLRTSYERAVQCGSRSCHRWMLSLRQYCHRRSVNACRSHPRLGLSLRMGRRIWKVLVLSEKFASSTDRSKGHVPNLCDGLISRLQIHAIAAARFGSRHRSSRGTR